MKKINSFLDEIFSNEISSAYFSLTRFFFYISMFVIYRYQRYPGVENFFLEANKIFWEPISFFKFFSYDFLSSMSSPYLPAIFFISLIACAFGFLFRLNSLIAFVLSLYLMGIPLNFGKIHHSNHMPVVILGILALCRYPGRLSVDSWFKYIFLKKREAERSFEYYWPYLACLLYFTLVYFGSGVQKLWYSGLSWIYSENMLTIILTRPTVTALGRWVGSFDLLPKVLAFYTVFIEIFAPLSFIGNKTKFFFMWSACLLHLGAQAVLGDHGNFLPYVFCFTIFIPWDFFKIEKLAKKLEKVMYKELSN